MAQSDADVKAWVGRRLGASVVSVELTDADYGDGLDDAKRWFSGIIGQLKAYKLTLTGVNEYDVPADCESVTNVIFDDKNSEIWDVYDWADVRLSPLGFGAYNRGYGVGDLSYITQSLQYQSEAMRVLSADKDWEWDRARQKLVLYPEGLAGVSNVMVYYLVSVLDLARLNTYEYDLVRRYALGSCMEILGYIRTKYGELPSATGSMSLNGDTLLSNADVIKSEAQDKATRLREPAHFVLG
tara:strand:- start:1084 stop:1806 length:723 start_codon:yes stop_codon:yes gene_type:complete